MDFIPNTDEQRKDMFKTIGVSSVEDLFMDIPEQVRVKGLLDIHEGKSELEVKKRLMSISKKNRTDHTSFLGAGCYNHFIPSTVKHLAGRSEFYTAYTPYQAEVSQGALQVFFEFQTLICQITGMEVANASMYDGASALAESCIMCANITKRDEIVISSTIHPDYKEVVRTYAKGRGFKVFEIEFDNKKGTTSFEKLVETVSDKTAGVLIQNPNFFGNIEELHEACELIHEKGALFVVCVVEPTSLGCLKGPGSFNADIVVGEGQSFGVNMNFGGPFLGFLATKQKYLRQMPGRLVGRAVDAAGKEGFILTLQAREQHIRREKASSNICTSQALCAISATIYLSSLGKTGFKELAQLNLQKAHYAFDEIRKLGFKARFNSHFYNEFIFEFDDPNRVNKELLDNGIVGGCCLGDYYETMRNSMLFCVTEMIDRDEITKLVNLLSSLK